MVMNIFPDLMEVEFLLRLLCACICGFVVGLERTKHQKTAGIRTYVIVAVGAAMFAIVSKYGFLDGLVEGTRADVSRVACNVVTGLGFLGAGIISVRDDKIIGLTTAAGIWAMAAIGVAFGVGMYFIGGYATVLVLIVQTSLQNSKMYAMDVKVPDKFIICMDDKEETFQRLRGILIKEDIDIVTTNIQRHKGHMLTYTMSVKTPRKFNNVEFVSQVSKIPSVKTIDV